MQTTPLSNASGGTLARLARLGLATALLLLFAPASAAFPQVDDGLGKHAFTVKLNLDLVGEGQATITANSQGVGTCLEFDETGQRLNVDVSGGGVMVSAPFLGEGGDPEFKPELPALVTSIASPLLRDVPLPPVPGIVLGPIEIDGKSYGWGTQEAGYSPSGCP